jgi:hypothetical protein
VDIAALTAFLAPCLPALLHAGQSVLDDVVTRVGADAYRHAEGLWQRLWPRLREKPAADEAARDVADRPDDTRMHAALEVQLEKLLTSDTTLAAEIAQLFEQAKAAGVVAVGERSVAVGGDVSGVIVTGDSSSVER